MIRLRLGAIATSAAACIAILASMQATAHHSRANFDTSSTIQITGTVIDYAWRNPHVFIEIEGLDANGENHVWLLESHSVTGMRRLGWDANTLKPGDQVTITGSPDHNPEKHFVLLSYLDMPDGERLYAFRNRNAPRVEPPAEASTDFSGTRSVDRRRSSFNEMAGSGIPKGWSYTEKALADAAQFSEDQNPELECSAVGIPRIMTYPYAINWYREEGVVRIFKEHLNETRTIWLNKEEANLDHLVPSYVGTSVGYFESERHLKVETTGFLPTSWGIANGVDSSSEKTVLEEYILSEDGMSMEVNLQVTDPLYLEKPATMSVVYAKQANREFAVVDCDPRAASRHEEAGTQ